MCNTSSLYFLVGSYLCVYVLNTTKLLATTLGSYFAVTKEEVALTRVTVCTSRKL